MEEATQNGSLMKTQVICEIGSNWECFQDIQDSIDYAKSVEAIPKLQCFKPEEITDKDSQPEYYEKLRSVTVPREWIRDLKGSGVFYSVFGLDSLAFLEKEISPLLYKIASGKAVDKSLIKAVACTHKPTIMSVGGCTLDEIRQATKWYQEGYDEVGWWSKLTLMHTMVCYKKCDLQLSAFRDRVIGSKLVSWGWGQNHSDESNLHLPSVAVALGANVCEAHFRLDHIKNTPDSPHSLNKEQFTRMIKLIQEVEDNIGNTERPTKYEVGNLKLARGKNG